ncbi:DNA translocase FtsK [Tianweitania sp.]|uniref:DNA translocase FtsK n=1 Tax=Tianweitania sp. TaxID=2021634 RepID=UPI00289CC520|nr:DNA translocase FtsK [Tianweitania sp.]
MRIGLSAPMNVADAGYGLRGFARRQVARLVGLSLLGLTALGVASLATWNVADPSFSHATDNPVTNAIGYPGAVFSDLATQFFGLAALAVLVPLAIWGVLLMTGHRIDRKPTRAAVWFLGGMFAAGVAGCFAPNATWPLPTGFGGVFGDIMLKLPALMLGAYPTGLVATILSVILAIPALALLAFGSGLVGRRAPVEDDFEDEDDLAVSVQSADEEDDRDSVLMGLMTHWFLSAQAMVRRLKGGNERQAPQKSKLRQAMVRIDRDMDMEAHYPAPSQRVEPGFGSPYAPDERHESFDLDRIVGVANPMPAAARAAPDMPVVEAPTRRPIVVEPPAQPVPQRVERVEPDWSNWTPVKESANGHVQAFRSMPGMVRGVRRPEPELTQPNEIQAEPDFAPLQDLTPDVGEDDAPFDMPFDAPYEDSYAEPVAPQPVASVAAMRQPAARRSTETPDQLFDAPAMAHGEAQARGIQRTDAAASSRVIEAPLPSRAKIDAPAPAPRPVAAPSRNYAASGAMDDGFIMPALEFLAEPKNIGRDPTLSKDALEQNARLLEGVLEDFGVKGEIIHVRPGPVVTLYELEPAPGIKSSRVIGLADDIARSMSAIAARVAVVPGRNAIGIELPNARRETVYLREMLASQAFDDSTAKLALALGKTINGDPVVVDIAKMPHVLVAGTTGSGKSVAINTMVLSLLYRMKPEQCRLIMIDPKMVELSVYDGIPHLLTPVVTDPKKAVVALKWLVREMEDRYRKMAKVGVRNIDGFNQRVAQATAKGEVITRTVQTGFDRETGEAIYESEELDLQPFPFIVVIIDEVADLMMVAGKDIEGAVQRLGQMARAAGIHVVMATQRPSVDVITGTIKANFPTRMSFQVTSKIDSRTILGEMGAEQLLGMGDMLYMAGGGRIQRVHGPFVSDDEVEKVVAHLKLQGVPDYLDAITEDDEEEAEDGASGKGGPAGTSNLEDSEDPYDQAVAVVLRDGKASTSYIQRRLGIGYNRAASIIERMEKEGIVGPANHAGKREILVPTEDDKF